VIQSHRHYHLKKCQKGQYPANSGILLLEKADDLHVHQNIRDPQHLGRTSELDDVPNQQGEKGTAGDQVGEEKVKANPTEDVREYES
jgi:hypothetical protein